MNSLQDTFGAAADAWDEDGHEELAKTFQEGAGSNDFFDLGNNDLGKKCQTRKRSRNSQECPKFFQKMYLMIIWITVHEELTKKCSC